MAITAIRTAVIEANYDWTLVRIETDEGPSGIGEAFCAPGLTATIRDLGTLLIGRDARQVEPLVRTLRLATAHAGPGAARSTTRSPGSRPRSGTSRHAHAGIPMWQLFGGRFRDRVRIYADCHAGDALIGLLLGAGRAPACPGSRREDAEVPRGVPLGTTRATPRSTRPRRTRGARGRWSDRGFTALKFDLDLPLLPNEDLYARTISARAAGAPGRHRPRRRRGRRAGRRRRVRPALAVCAGRRAPAGRRARGPAAAVARGPDAAGRTSTPSRDCLRRTTTPIATGENLYLLKGFASLLGRRRRRHPGARHPEGRRAGRDAPDRRARRHPLAAARAAQHLGADRHDGVGPGLRLDPELPGAGVARGERPVLRHRSWSAATGRSSRTGMSRVPDGPGLGIELDLDECRRYALPGEPFFA